MAISYNKNRYKTKSGKKYYLALDDTFDNESYSVYSFTMNSDFTNKTGTLMYTEKITEDGIPKGATDNLINDNADLIDAYGSINFMNTVRNQVTKWVLEKCLVTKEFNKEYVQEKTNSMQTKANLEKVR